MLLLYAIIECNLHGSVKVSTGTLKYDKRVEPGDSLNHLTLKLNANDNNVALAA